MVRLSRLIERARAELRRVELGLGDTGSCGCRGCAVNVPGGYDVVVIVEGGEDGGVGGRDLA